MNKRKDKSSFILNNPKFVFLSLKTVKSLKIIYKIFKLKEKTPKYIEFLSIKENISLIRKNNIEYISFFIIFIYIVKL